MRFTVLRRALPMLACLLSPATAGEVEAQEPRALTYREVDGRELTAYVFDPTDAGAAASADGILLFHGGGWAAGSPTWTFEAARRFARAGLVAVAVEYRLSDVDVTPVEALSDVCAAFAWARGGEGGPGLTGRVAGYGVSAGGHLVASTVTVGCADPAGGRRSGPDALLLWSPALDVSGDAWFRRLLQNRVAVAALSPVEHVRPWTPPTSIVQGDRDTLTPLAGARSLCTRLRTLGGTCELNVYRGVGHLLTRNLQEQERDFDPDPEAVRSGIERHLTFLRELGFISGR